uniref:Uncharacterized protein n=1 Tax=Pseudo-nitzschia arenysensis TaxID=697910 RepID=A0A7R9ZU34_9STRA|mmetsp:Transcript_691/g.1667  ORF Transcript_691/g.1667 Transcript_691/m.1667 type:complete len:201 (+) Transcript_691:188-790(+)
MRSPAENQKMARNAQTRHRRARFNNVVTVTEIPSHRVYAFDERFALWYTQSEYRCFRLQENIRKRKTNLKSELSDRVRDNRCRPQKVHKRRHESKHTIGDKHKSTKISNNVHDVLSRAIEARMQTNRRLAQIQWQMQRYQQLQNVAPAWSFNSPTPSVSKSTVQAKQGIFLPNIPFDFSSNTIPIRSTSTPMNSPVARGA